MKKQNVLINGVNTEVTIEDKSSRTCPSELNQSCLNNVTISWGDKKFEGLEFEIEDTFDSHDNEGDDTIFTAEEEQDGIKYVFAVEVSVEYNYSNSGNIQAVSWKYLEIDEKQNPRMDPAVRSDFDDPVVEAYGYKTGGNAASNSGTYGGSYGASGEDQGHDLLHEDDELFELEDDELDEGTCGYTTNEYGKKIHSPGDTNKRGTTPDVRTNFMKDSKSNPFS